MKRGGGSSSRVLSSTPSATAARVPRRRPGSSHASRRVASRKSDGSSTLVRVRVRLRVRVGVRGRVRVRVRARLRLRLRIRIGVRLRLRLREGQAFGGGALPQVGKEQPRPRRVSDQQHAAVDQALRRHVLGNEELGRAVRSMDVLDPHVQPHHERVGVDP
eukprot:scaffold60334_cov67-Phaeocystis_antarctica.AAC.1